MEKRDYKEGKLEISLWNLEHKKIPGHLCPGKIIQILFIAK